MDRLALQLTAGPLWMLLGILVATTLFAIWTYQHTVPATTRAKKNILIALRSLGLAALLFAIFEPILSSTSTQTVTPSMALVMDNSQSMLLPERGHTITAGAETRRDVMLKNVHQVIPSDVLTNPARTEGYTVGDHTLPFPKLTLIDSIRATAAATDLASAFQAIRDARKTHNTEAIVLYTDGAFTTGQNPIYPAEQLGVPVYAVGVGDSTEPRDVAVTELFTNEVATVGATQPVDITVHYGGVKPGEHVLLELFEEGQKIGDRNLELAQSSGDQAISFNYTPQKEGIQKLTARLSTIAGEATDKNNLRIAYVKVLKNKFHVVLFAGAPSSDLSFLRQYFVANPSLELTTYVQKQGAEFYEGTPTRDKLKQVDLVVLVGFPIAQTSDATLSLVRELLTQENRSLLFIPSRQLDLSKLAELGDALPFRFDPKASPSANELKVGMSVSPTATNDPVLRIPAEERNKVSWDALAPLFKTETHFNARPESQTLADATVQGVKLNEPLLVTRHIGNARQVALMGYGIWQWKLSTFGREQAFEMQSRTRDTAKSYSALDLFLSNATRWLTTQEENKRVKIEPNRKFYEAGERIDFLGQVYDESYIPVERADVTLRIQGATLQKPLEIVLSPNGNGRYSGSLPQGLVKGDYTYTGVASLSGRQIGSDQGRFNVGDYNIEFAEPRMRSDILREITERTGGKFYTPETAQNLLKDILANPRFKAKELTDKRDFEIWNSWPLLTLALLFFAAEWLMRKRLGML